ncbi:Anaphase-promoting complex subunit 2 [Dissophora ornata]|nr:Anaphase-promoting complex subunit 2 [Dissophora ornata]
MTTTRYDSMSNVPSVKSPHQEYVAAAPYQSGSAEWVISAFYNVIHAIHTRFAISRQLAHLFDERLRVAMSKESPLDFTSLEVSSRFLTEFSAELAIRLPPSFDQVAHLYFETIFQQYEISHPNVASGDHLERSSENTDAMMGLAEQTLGYDGDHERGTNGQQLGKKRRRIMQDGRFAMDLFVDDMDDELVEQIFHGGHGAAGVESLEKEGQIQAYLDLCHKLEEIGFASHMTDVVTRMLYEKVENKVFNSFKGRIKEFFNIIVECPDSKPAVHDLKACIEWSGQREQLQNAILMAMEKRLLHPGAETTDIIEFYICTIKYLRILDPSGVMLDHAARAINQYLRTRDDTMRAIVSCIVDDSSDLLANPAEGIQVNAEADDEGSDDEIWVPEPVNAGPDLSSARRRMADIISVLANIYDTNDRFIEEFQTILADRLLQATDFKIDREIRQLELLKLRFGETDLQHCEVMLADVAESKRVNANIQSLHPDMAVSATIASRYYWPEIENETLELPTPYKRLLESFSTAFQASKPAQKLSLFPSLGMVELELELEDRTLQLQVEPIHASIIQLFEEQENLHVAEDVLEPKVQFWVREGVLAETSRLQYHLIENSSSV